MAKQSGIHQLRGKVGSHSYYRQAGVTDGLMRQIPAGLSAAVKNGENYANTRLNNAEFGEANRLSVIAYNSVPQRISTMFRRFAVAAMTKQGLEYVKSGVGDWGRRIPEGTFDTLMVDLLENHAKAGRYDGQYGTFDIDNSDPTDIGVTLVLSLQRIAELRAMGIDGIVVAPSFSALAVSNVDGTYMYVGGTSYHSLVDLDFTGGTAQTFTEEVEDNAAFFGMRPADFAAAHNFSNFGTWVTLGILPYRIVNGQKYTLREMATYVAGAMGNLEA